MKTNTSLFLLTRKNYCGWDEVNAIMVRATTPLEARGVAGANSSGEGAFVWTNPKLTKCRRIKSEGKIGMIIRDFKAG